MRWIKQLFWAGSPNRRHVRVPSSLPWKFHEAKNFLNQFSMTSYERKSGGNVLLPSHPPTPVVVGDGIEFTTVCRTVRRGVWGAGANECGWHWGTRCRYQHASNTWRARIFPNDVMEYEKRFGIMSDKDKAEKRKSFSFIQCGKLLPMERRKRTQNRMCRRASFVKLFFSAENRWGFIFHKKMTSLDGRERFFEFFVNEKAEKRDDDAFVRGESLTPARWDFNFPVSH